MSVETKIWLPHEVDWDEVADIAAILLGATPKLDWLENGTDRKFPSVEVPGISWKAYQSGSMCPDFGDVSFDVPMGIIRFNYGQYKEGKLLKRHASPLSIAVGLGILNIFGGSIQAADSENEIITTPMPDYDTNPEHGEDWARWQFMKMSIMPINLKQIERVTKFAKYDEDTFNVYRD